MRQKLIEFLNMNCGYVDEMPAEKLADYLLANGVIIPLVKVGQTVWFLRKGEIGKGTIVNMFIEIGDSITYSFNVSTDGNKKLVFCDFDIGETVFDKEGKAEKALCQSYDDEETAGE